MRGKNKVVSRRPARALAQHSNRAPSSLNSVSTAPASAPGALFWLSPSAFPAWPRPQYPLELSLEEIYHGCLKKVTHKRKVLLFSGEYIEEERPLTVDVKPGLPTGTRFVFEG